MNDIFQVLEGYLRVSTVRHGVIASNIANVDTPGYQARDVTFDDALSKAAIELRNTDPGHLQPADRVAGGSVAADRQPSWGDRNNVELDREVSKMTENAIFFQAAATLLSKNIQMYKQALKRT